MKIEKYFIGIILAILSCYSCSEDLELNNGVTKERKLIRIAASLDENSRLAYSEGEEEVDFTWEDDDKLKVYNQTNKSITEFKLKSGAGTAFAEFEGTMDVEEGSKLYVLYHNTLSVDSDVNEEGNIEISMQEQDGSRNDDFQIMYGETTYSASNPLHSLKLNHLVSVLKLTISTDKTLNSITFNHENLRSKATLVLGENPTTIDGINSGDLIYNLDNEVEGDKGITLTKSFVPSNGVTTIYVYTLSPKFYKEDDGSVEIKWIRPMFTATDGENTYVNSMAFDDKNIERGKMYELSSGLFTMKDFDNESNVNGSVSYPYEIANKDQLYSFMLRVAQGMKNKEGYEYWGCHYKLTSDIALNNELIWKPMTLHYGSFDGNGHIISGNMIMHNQWQTGFFSSTFGSTIKNLTLDLNIEFEKPSEHNDWFGTFVGSLNSESELINCLNKSNVAGNFANLGGLVGYNLNSSIEACGNEGNLEGIADNYCGAIGGIVASNDTSSGYDIHSFNPSIKCCYNTGSFKTKMDWQLKVGGIIGNMASNSHEQTNDIVTCCWSNSTLTLDGELYDDNYSETIQAGGIVGYQRAYEVSNCYWNFSKNCAIGLIGESVNNSNIEIFLDQSPTTDQITALNNSLSQSNSSYRFDDSGKIILNGDSSN